MTGIEVRVYEGLQGISRTVWNGLLDGEATPFLRWEWLEALESSGCVSQSTSWVPLHVVIHRGADVVAAAPAYLRDDTDGDFSRDWGWAQAAMRAGVPFYPKLVVGVPFTPVTGRRLLVAPGERREQWVPVLLAGLQQLAERAGAATVQVLFPVAEEAGELEAHGWSRRIDFQFHWLNHGYATPEAFLACFNAKKRHQSRRERAAPEKAGVTIRTVRGEELARDRARWARDAHDLHRSTVDKLMWGRRWLNRAFYDLVFERMPENLEVVAAERDGRLVAGAFNLSSPTHLWGRYWGCFEEIPFLHFNVCLYHSIDECIRRGAERFEGGAGGQHKLARGFEPMETYSNHHFLDARPAGPFRAAIAREAAERQAALLRWRAESPILIRRPDRATIDDRE
jgi:hypothetical protein